MIKFVQSLGTAKGRRAERAFLAEGTRCVLDSLPHFRLRMLCATAEWLQTYGAEATLGAEAPPPPHLVHQVTKREIERMSQQNSPQPVLAVFDLPEIPPYEYNGDLTLALDAVQDPGNLGTIIRLADWFGITHILAGPGTADAFAPKVVQATMGALARVKVHRVENLAATLTALASQGANIIGTFLDGQDLYKSEIPITPRPIIVMGNEGNGISPEVAATVTKRILIPSFPPGRQTSESLNVAMATGIIVSELSRRIYG